MNRSRPAHRPQRRYRFAAALVLALAGIAGGASGPGRFDASLRAQTPNPCALIPISEIQPLAGNASVADGVSNALESRGFAMCRYSWGTGTSRFTLDVVVNDASRVFAGMTADQIKQRLLESVKAGTADAVIADVGEAAVFKPDSPVYASAFALVKDRILGVHLDGAFARERKDEVIGLLKAAASRL